MITRIISGGQTGVDRAGLDAALKLGIAIGGWCPRGRKAEDGTIPLVYPLTETTTAAYPERTRRNIQEADATLILVDNDSQVVGGTLLTLNMCRYWKKPCCVIKLDFLLGGDTAPSMSDVRQWLERDKVQTLNIAGPRESKYPGIHDRAKAFLVELLRGLGATA